MNTPTVNPVRPALRSALAHWYLRHKMPDRLAEAVLVCAYLETLLADIPAAHTGRLKPVFDTEVDLLRTDWHSVRYFDLWLDTATGEITDRLPPGEGEPLPLNLEPLPEATQRRILFSRFAYLFA